MKYFFVFLIGFNSQFLFAETSEKKPVNQILREGRPPLTTRSASLIPIDLLTNTGARYSFYEVPQKIRLFEDGSVYYVRKDYAGRTLMNGWLNAEDLLVKLPIKTFRGFKLGQKVCVIQKSAYLKVGETLELNGFYENEIVGLFSRGFLRLLDSKTYAVKIYDIEPCTK
jgi:hypothetical protein